MAGFEAAGSRWWGSRRHRRDSTCEGWLEMARDGGVETVQGRGSGGAQDGTGETARVRASSRWLETAGSRRRRVEVAAGLKVARTRRRVRGPARDGSRR